MVPALANTGHITTPKMLVFLSGDWCLPSGPHAHPPLGVGAAPCSLAASVGELVPRFLAQARHTRFPSLVMRVFSSLYSWPCGQCVLRLLP